jgi:hypothetical protein
MPPLSSYSLPPGHATRTQSGSFDHPLCGGNMDNTIEKRHFTQRSEHDPIKNEAYLYPALQSMCPNITREIMGCTIQMQVPCSGRALVT